MCFPAREAMPVSSKANGPASQRSISTNTMSRDLSIAETSLSCSAMSAFASKAEITRTSDFVPRLTQSGHHFWNQSQHGGGCVVENRGTTRLPSLACTARGGTLENNELSPSAIVGCAKAALARLGYERPANIAVCTAAMTSPAAVPIIEKPRMRSSLSPTRAVSESGPRYCCPWLPLSGSDEFQARAHGQPRVDLFRCSATTILHRHSDGSPGGVRDTAAL
jgi:hypothetical protein